MALSAKHRSRYVVLHLLHLHVSLGVLEGHSILGRIFKNCWDVILSFLGDHARIPGRSL